MLIIFTDSFIYFILQDYNVSQHMALARIAIYFIYILAVFISFEYLPGCHPWSVRHCPG